MIIPPLATERMHSLPTLISRQGNREYGDGQYGSEKYRGGEYIDKKYRSGTGSSRVEEASVSLFYRNLATLDTTKSIIAICVGKSLPGKAL